MTNTAPQQVHVHMNHRGQIGVGADEFKGVDKNVAVLKILFVTSVMITLCVCALVVFWGNILALFTTSTLLTLASMGMCTLSIFNYANGDSSLD
jgi:hypothetical protein